MLYKSNLREPPFNLQWGGDKLFISTRLGGALESSNLIICLSKPVPEIFFLFYVTLGSA